MSYLLNILRKKRKARGILGIIYYFVLFTALGLLLFAAFGPDNMALDSLKEEAPKTTITPQPTINTTKIIQGELNKELEEWGIAKQIDEHTWTIKVGEDERMATPEETLDALNNYRSRHGAGSLTWDNNLAQFAKARAEYFYSTGQLDGHRGFEEYLSSEENVKKLGFSSYGENSSSGYKLIGVHLIEWIYAADKDHNDNQLNPSWTHVGIGIKGTATNLIFAKDRI